MSKLYTWAKGGIVLSKFHSGVEKERLKSIIECDAARIHFVGALGAGMRPLIELSRKMGHTVSGSDREGGAEYERLVRDGCRLSTSHKRENAIGADLVVYTLAAEENNPEILYAEENRIPTASRAEYLGALMEKYKVRIGVSGSHGKSTTSAMIDKILDTANLFPTTVIGANLSDTGTPLRIGENEYFVYEACEYKDSFLCFSPTYAVFSNLELEHVDYFENLEKIKTSFSKAMNKSETAFLNIDDENLASLIPYATCEVITFGESERADYQGEFKQKKDGKYYIKIRHGGREICEIKLSVIGKHNAKNALAAATVALHIGIPQNTVRLALESFVGIERRLEVIGERGVACVYYDYAHHPTEIKSAIEAVRSVTGGKIAVIFKPHTYSRTSYFLEEFISALSLADRIYLCEISAIREKMRDGVSSEKIVQALIDKAELLEEEKNIGKILDSEDFSAIIIMGAANLDCVRKSILTN